jgi:hypothetical protein
MPTYRTNVARQYGTTAGFNTKWSGIREILQNALDGNDIGYRMRIEHGKARDRSGEWALKVVNEGVTLNTDALVLGFSTKTGRSDQRGEHGEGLIVGMNALLNLGCEVWIRTGDEVWAPKYEISDSGLETLIVDIRKQPKLSGDFIVEIKGVSPEEWEDYKDRMLFFGDKEDKRVEIPYYGTVLMDPKYQNQLFVKGIHVCKLPDNYYWGYDLNIDLNRDREVASPWTLRWKIRDLLISAFDKDLVSLEDVWPILENDDYGESYAIREDEFRTAAKMHEQFVEVFTEMHGDKAIPVTNIGESQRVEHFGKKGVIVSKAIANILETSLGKLEDRLQEQSLGTQKKYQYSELFYAEHQILHRICDLVSEIEPWFSIDLVNVVDFFGEDVNGTFCNREDGCEINLAKRIMKDPQQALETLVHEVAHKYGKDAENAHDAAEKRILASIIVSRLFPDSYE